MRRDGGVKGGPGYGVAGLWRAWMRRRCGGTARAEVGPGLVAKMGGMSIKMENVSRESSTDDFNLKFE